MRRHDKATFESQLRDSIRFKLRDEKGEAWHNHPDLVEQEVDACIAIVIRDLAVRSVGEYLQMSLWPEDRGCE